MYTGPQIVTSGLVLHLDAINSKSNITLGGITLKNLVDKQVSASVWNGSTSTDRVDLDGINDYIEIINSITSTILSPSIVTFNIWFKPSSNITSNTVTSLISRGNYNTAGGFFIHMYNNIIGNNAPSVQANCSFSTTNSYSYNNTNAYLLNGFNKWNNVTVVYDSQISLYINGEHKQTVNRQFPTIIYGNNTINTGGDTNLILCAGLGYAPLISNGYWEPYKGSFSNIQMYNRRLTSQEVLQNFNATRSRFGI
jgi:hypothetical protein